MFFDGEITLSSIARERTTTVTLVSYKHNVAAEHESSKLLIDQWAVTTRIGNEKNLDIGLQSRCIMGYVQMVYIVYYITASSSKSL